MTSSRGTAGLTVMETLISTFVILAIGLGVWFTYDANRKVWDRGMDKVLLQQSCTQACEAIARDVRLGASVTLSGGNDLTIYDRSGNVVRRYFIDSGVGKLSTASDEPVVQEVCSNLSFTLNADTSEVRFQLTLKDRWENAATIRSSAHLRNAEGSFVAVY